MSKSSIDYAEIAGLAVALSRLGCKPDKTNEEGIVSVWLTSRLIELRSK